MNTRNYIFGFLVFALCLSNAAYCEELDKAAITLQNSEKSTWYEDTKKQFYDDLANVKKISPIFCKSFENIPLLYKEVKEADMTACEFYEKHRNKTPTLTKTSCYSPPSEKNQPKSKKFLVRSSGGSCQSSSIARISDDNQPEIEFIEPLNSGENGYGMGHHDKILKTPSPFTLVTNETYSDLRAVTDQGSYILCRFTNRLDGWRVTEWSRASVCEKFANDEFAPTGRKLEHGETAADYLDDNVPRYADRYELSTVDIDRDGTTEKILKMTYYSGAGCGSTDIWLRAVHKGKHATDPTRILDKKIAELTGDARDAWSVIDIDGKSYIANNADKMIADKMQFSERAFKDRILYEYKTDGFQEVCRLKPIFKRINIKDIPHNGDLGDKRDIGYRQVEDID